MNNRWGRPLQPKASLRGSGQSNINININFNAVKEKASMFGGKKIDNFIEVSNEPKSNISRPNVSIETLKHKKKVILNKEDQPIEQELNRKKSKSKIVQEICTPQKMRRNKDIDHSKSVGRKSTNKSNSSSFQNLGKFYKRSSPRQSNQEEIQSSQENSRPNSRSRSKSQSHKKLFKNSSKPKISTIHTTKVKTTAHNSKKQQEKPIPVKRKKTPGVDKVEQPAQPQTTKKPPTSKPKTKPKSDNKKTPFPIPQHSSDQAQPFNSCRGQSLDANQTNKKVHVEKDHYSDAQYLAKIIMIQKNIRASRGRKQFINAIDAMNDEIEEKKHFILNQDPKFWDDAESDSIIKADDEEAFKEPTYHGNSDFQKSSFSRHRANLLENSEDQPSGISKSRTLESNQREMMQRILKLEDNLKKQQAKTQELQLENKQLKVSLQRVSVQSGSNSNQNSMESSFRPHRSSVRETYETDPFLQEQSLEKNSISKRIHESNQFCEQNEIVLVLPTKKTGKIQKVQDKRQKELEQKGGILSAHFECASPRSIIMNINKDLMDLLKRKENKLQQNFNKEIEILNGSIYSPKTHSNKLNELNRIFEREKDKYRNKLSKVTQEIKEMTSNQRIEGEDGSEKYKKKQKDEQIEEVNHINLNSHRSISSSQENEPSESSQESASHLVLLNNRQQLSQQIQSRNTDVIRIFDEVQRQHENGEGQQEVERPHEYLPNNLEEDDSNFEEVGINKQNAGPKGLETALLFIKEYCMSFIEFIRNSDVHKNTFIQNICTPIQYDSFQFLKSYRTTLEDSNDATYNSLEKEYIYPFFKLIYSKTQVITRQAFNDFNEVYEKFQGECHFPIERQFFLNSILDAFNESLDYKRPCSFYGEPPVWISQSRALKNFDLLNQNLVSRQTFSHSQKFDQICGISIARVIEWSTCLCGFIPESPEIQNVVVDQEEINHIRETRIALMLQKDLLEGEQAMIDFVMEQTQVRIQLGVFLMDTLVSELLAEFQLFGK